MRIESQAVGEAKPEAYGLGQPAGTKTKTGARPAAPSRRLDLATHSALQRMLLQVALACSALCSIWLVMRSAATTGDPLLPEWQVLYALFPLATLFLPPRDGYQLSSPLLTENLRQVGQALHATAILLALRAVLAAVGLALLPWPMLSAILLVHLALGAALRLIVQKLARASQPPVRVVVVGADTHGIAVARYLRQRHQPTHVIGFADDRRERIERSLLAAPFLGSASQLAHHLNGVDAVVIAIPNEAIVRIRSLANLLRNGQVSVYLAPPGPLLEMSRLDVAQGDMCLPDMVPLGMQGLPLPGRIAKRLFDIVFSLMVLVLFLPFGLVIATLIKLESPGPVIYRQGRYGQGCRLFDLYKFRSMRFDPVVPGGEIRLTQRVDSRVTRLGSFLRRTSLDEFPQFINVLLGQMSVIGPRPHPPGVRAGDRVYEDVVQDFLERYKVRPGITGWAQVNGLRGSTFTEDHLMRRFASDIEYIRAWSFELDLWIVLKTVWEGLRGQNAY